MDNYTNNNIDELALMRSQMEELKAKLDREVKINEGNVRKLQKRNMGFINKYLVFAWLALPLMILMYVGIKYAFGLSWLITIVTILFFIVDIYLDTHFNRMKNSDIESMSLVDMGEKLLSVKRIRRKQFKYGLIALLFWVVWFMVEVYFSIETGKCIVFPAEHIIAVVMTSCIGIGAIVGGIIGYMIYRKMQRDSDSVIEQIKSLKAE